MSLGDAPAEENGNGVCYYLQVPCDPVTPAIALEAAIFTKHVCSCFFDVLFDVLFEMRGAALLEVVELTAVLFLYAAPSAGLCAIGVVGAVITTRQWTVHISKLIIDTAMIKEADLHDKASLHEDSRPEE